MIQKTRAHVNVTQFLLQEFLSNIHRENRTFVHFLRSTFRKSVIFQFGQRIWNANHIWNLMAKVSFVSTFSPEPIDRFSKSRYQQSLFDVNSIFPKFQSEVTGDYTQIEKVRPFHVSQKWLLTISIQMKEINQGTHEGLSLYFGEIPTSSSRDSVNGRILSDLNGGFKKCRKWAECTQKSSNELPKK
jgi:hypothetical protein